jgi:hypothetical protein
MLRLGVEEPVGVVHEAEQDYDRLLCHVQEGALLGKLGLGHLKLLWTGHSDGPRFTSQTTQHTSWVVFDRYSEISRACPSDLDVPDHGESDPRSLSLDF